MRNLTPKIFTTLITMSGLIALADQVAAQTTQTVTGDENTQIANNSGFINTGQITIILGSEAALVKEQQERDALNALAPILTQLSESGELQVTEAGLRLLARGAVAALVQQDITRDKISDRQFKIPYQKTYNIAGTRHRITYTWNNCGGNYGISFTFNRDSTCVFTGGTYQFEDGGVNYDLVFDGYSDDTANFAQFTIYPSE